MADSPVGNNLADEGVYGKYLAVTSNLPPTGIFDALEPHLPASGDAIDLGCGAGRGTLWLASRGLSVTAVDAKQEGLDILSSTVAPGMQVEMVCSSFQDLKLHIYDVVVACFSLFFLPPPDFEAFWKRAVKAIRPGGLFAGEFLGENDDWSDRNFTLMTRGQVESLFEGFDLLHLDEEDKDGETAVGTRKHCHVFHVIARKA